MATKLNKATNKPMVGTNYKVTLYNNGTLEIEVHVQSGKLLGCGSVLLNNAYGKWMVSEPSIHIESTRQVDVDGCYHIDGKPCRMTTYPALKTNLQEILNTAAYDGLQKVADYLADCTKIEF